MTRIRPSIPVTLVLIAILAGAALRFVDLTSVPPALNQDEAVYGYDAYSILLTGRDHLGHPFPFTSVETFGDWSSPLLSFVSVPAVAVFGLMVSTLRGVSAAIGVATIPLVYLLALQLFERRSIAVLTAWVIALSPWAIQLSRWAIIPTVVPAAVAATMLAIVWSLRRQSSRGIVWAALVAGIAVMGYHAMKIYIPLLLIAACCVYARRLLSLRREALLYAALCFAIIAGPILYLTAFDPGGSARFQQTSVFNAGIVDAGVLAGQYFSYFSPSFLFISGDGDPMHSLPGFGVELTSLLPFLIAGLAWLAYEALAAPVLGRRVKRMRPAGEGPVSSADAPVDTANDNKHWVRSSCLFLLVALALYPIPGSLTLPNPQTLRAAHLLPLSALVAAAGAVALWDVARRLLLRAPALARRAALAALLLVAAIPIHNELHDQYHHYFDDYPAQVAPYFQYGLEQALNYAQVHAAEYDEIWVTDTNQPYIYVLFFNRVSPNDVHTMLQVRRNPPDFNQVYSFGKYRFLSLPPGVAVDTLPVLDSISEPGGGVAYLVRGGRAPDGRRLLVIARR